MLFVNLLVCNWQLCGCEINKNICYDVKSVLTSWQSIKFAQELAHWPWQRLQMTQQMAFILVMYQIGLPDVCFSLLFLWVIAHTLISLVRRGIWSTSLVTHFTNTSQRSPVRLCNGCKHIFEWTASVTSCSLDWDLCASCPSWLM